MLRLGLFKGNASKTPIDLYRRGSALCLPSITQRYELRATTRDCPYTKFDFQNENFVGFPTIVLTHTEKNTAFLPQTHEIQCFHALNFHWHSWCKSRTKQTACESHERISLTHFRYGISQQRRVS